MTSNVEEFSGTRKELEDIVKLKKATVIVIFNATWCAPCRKFAGELPKIAADYPGLSFYTVDIDKNGPLADTFSVRTMPAFKFLKLNEENEVIVAGEAIGKDAKIVRKAIDKYK